MASRKNERLPKIDEHPRTSRRPPVGGEKSGLGALAALGIGIGIIVWLALPKAGDTQRGGSADPPSATSDAERVAAHPTTAGSLERLAEASCELAVLTDKSDAEIAEVANVEAIAKLLDIRHCGPACDAVKKVLRDTAHFEIEVTKSADYILPPKDSYDTIAAGLTPSERASIGRRASTVVLRAHGPSTIEQLPARTAFAATAAVAEALSGLVYDEVVRRIETSSEFAEHVVTVPLGQNVFAPKQILIQLYRRNDGTARLLTLGMTRFGSPDFTMHGAPMEFGSSLANVMNVAASFAAAGRVEVPIVVTLADVSRVASRPPEQLAINPGASTPVVLDIEAAERTEGDPENEMIELVPRGGSTPSQWAGLTTALFGASPQLVFEGPSKELDAIAARSRRELPAALKRFEAGEGALFVKGPFPIPPESRTDGGAASEWMWINVSSCNARSCSGALANTPGYATNLAAGRVVSLPRETTSDFLLRLRDGGTTGGDSIRHLQGR